MLMRMPQRSCHTAGVVMGMVVGECESEGCDPSERCDPGSNWMKE